MHICSAALSDRGLVREENEDRFLQDDSRQVYGVADGIGGLPCGAEAAECAVRAFREYVARDPSPLDRPIADLSPLVLRVNEAVVALGRQLSPDRGLGCTLTVGLVRGDSLHLAHVGDSRCYVWSQRRLELLTIDHNVETDPLFRFPPARLAGLGLAQRGALTRCLGQFTPLEVDTVVRPIAPGETYLFCTDGITRLLRDDEIAQEIDRRNEDPAGILAELVALANRRGGYDNATGVVVRVFP